MLDDLLGRRELKERIADLEEERDRLAERLDAENERRREAVSQRQEAEERINQLEDRIAGLEGELEQRQDDEQTQSFERVETIGQHRVQSVIDRLSSVRTDSESALSTAMKDTVPEDVRTAFGDRWPLIERALPCVGFRDDVGLVRAILAPPRVPEPFVTWDDRFTIEQDWFRATGPGQFALVRADLFALGRFEDGTLRYERGFESDVMGQHSKGGYSQARFERRRKEQIAEHVDRCRAVLEERPDHPLILVGDGRIVSRLDDRAVETGRVDASGSPKTALESAFRDFWTTRLYLP